MIKEAMNGSEEARKLGLPRTDLVPAQVSEIQLLNCLDLLAAIAYIMTLGLADRNRLSSGITAPNFERLTQGRMRPFILELEKRYQTKAGQGLIQDMDALAAMNDFLHRGVFDSDVTGFKEIEFRNRSLQEFLTAYYLCTKATREDGNLWWDRLYLPHDPESEQFYNVWQFVSEMPGTKRPGIDSDGTGHGVPKAIMEEHWLEAIEPLYRPTFVLDDNVSRKALAAGDGTAQQPAVSAVPQTKSGVPQRDARRSCEMIFRTWPQLEHLCKEGDPRANGIRNRWWGEFESIVAGDQGTERQQSAKELINDLLFVRGGTFQREVKSLQYVIKKVRRYQIDWRRILPHFSSKIIQQSDSDPHDEEPSVEWERPLVMLEVTSSLRTEQMSSFSIGKSCVAGVWFQLFCPRVNSAVLHFERGSSMATPNRLPLGTSWFSAWCFCRWVRLENQSCRLPWALEWNYILQHAAEQGARVLWLDDPDRTYQENALDDENAIAISGTGSEWLQDRLLFGHEIGLDEMAQGAGEAVTFRSANIHNRGYRISEGNWGDVMFRLLRNSTD